MCTLASETPAPNAPWHLLEAGQDRGLTFLLAPGLCGLSSGWPVSSTLIRNKTKQNVIPSTSKLRAWASEAGHWQAW